MEPEISGDLFQRDADPPASSAWSCWCGVWHVSVTGGAGAGPGRDEYLQLADNSVEAQADAVSFGDR
ncbi:hypothetical protein, partial [Streptomyces sp. NPDC001933]|uniref:hypothetical protein n=1 Tax=Streptomyces sp. NPDC001933 TaxID=3364626 RepID=UPI003683B4D8